MKRLSVLIGAALVGTALGACGQAASNDSGSNTPADDSSLDGILFSAVERGVPKLYVTADDGTATQLETGELSAYSADWSPDKDQIVFVGETGGVGSDIYTMNADGSNIERLLATPLFEGDPTWAPDGRTVYFWQSDEEGAWRVKALDVATGSVVPVEGTVNNDAMIDVSPSGDQLAVSRNMNGEVSVEVVALTPEAEAHSFPEGRGAISWSTSGEQLAYSDSNYKLHITTLATGETLDISLPRNAGTSITAWAPDDASLLVLTSSVSPGEQSAAPEMAYLVDTRSGEALSVNLGGEGTDYFGGVSWQ